MGNLSKKLPKVCVIILSWNNKRDILETILSLQKSRVERFEMEILVIDNGSTDGTPQAIEKLRVTVKRLDRNYGFAKGNNIGIKEALDRNCDYVALLNGDTVVDKDLIKNILQEHQNFASAGAISPKIYFAKGYEYHKKYKLYDLGRVIWYAGGKMDWDNIYGSNRGVDEVDKGQFDQSAKTDFVTGCFVMFKAEALIRSGLFDERYFAYMEDLDLSQRMKMAGWNVLYCSKGILWHKVSQSSGIGSGQNDYYLTRNRMLFGMTYGVLRTKFALLRESIKLLLNGRTWQKKGIRDFYLGRFGKGSYEN